MASEQRRLAPDRLVDAVIVSRCRETDRVRPEHCAGPPVKTASVGGCVATDSDRARSVAPPPAVENAARRPSTTDYVIRGRVVAAVDGRPGPGQARGPDQQPRQRSMSRAAPCDDLARGWKVAPGDRLGRPDDHARRGRISDWSALGSRDLSRPLDAPHRDRRPPGPDGPRPPWTGPRSTPR